MRTVRRTRRWACHGVLSGLVLASSLAGGTVTENFDGSSLPVGMQVFNAAALSATGGVGGSGMLRLTSAANSQEGALVIEDLDGGAPVYGFRARFQGRIGGGTAIPADGWSFSAGPDIPDASFGEAGAGSGIRIQFDIYDNVDGDPNNGAGEAPAIRVVVGGQTVASTPILPLSDMVTTGFVPVEILMDADGALTVAFNGKEHFSKYYIPGYQPLSFVRYAFGARTGGLNANHLIDDLSIETFLEPKPGVVAGPASQRVLAGRDATFSAVLNNADGASLQWLRDGSPIPGATGPSHTISPATLADDGARISLRVTQGATVITTPEAVLGVVQIELPAVAAATFDFNADLPAGTAAYGAGLASDGFSEWLAQVSPSGGVGDSGVLMLTEAINSQSGAFLVEDLNAGAPVYGVAARFDVRIGGGSDIPADGMSFNFAADLPDAPSGGAEEGVGSGLRVCFDTYDNADGNPNNAAGEAPAITLKWGSTVVAESRLALSDLVTGDGFAEVVVRLTADGLLDVAWNGKVLLYRTAVPGFGSISGGRFGFFARTGGLNANHWVDNLQLYTYLSAPLRVSRQPVSPNVLVGHPATLDVEVNTPDGTTYQWFRNGAPIGGATGASYTLPAAAAGDDGTKFKVSATLNGVTVTSDEVELNVVNLTAPAAPQLSYDFDAGLPAGAEVGGTSGLVDSFGGINDSGVLKLTSSENAQIGGFRSGVIEGGAQLQTLNLAVDILAGLGTTPPADGFSVNLGPDLPLTAPGDAENGAGQGLTLAFDTYDNGGGEAPSVDVRYKGALVRSVLVPLALVNSGEYRTLLLRVSEQGMLDLAFGDAVLFEGLQLPGYIPMSSVRVALYARTGGLNASYWFDNVRLGYTVPATVSITDEPDDVLVLAGQSATFGVQVSNPAGVTYQWRRNGADINGATSSTFTTPALTLADDGARYSVVVRAGGGSSVTSRDAAALVMARFDAGANPAIQVDFDDGSIPFDALALGTAVVSPSGGVGNSPFLILTEAINSQGGVFLLPAPATPASITDFTATWAMRVGGGTDVPADGFSFVFANDVPDVVFGEDGGGSGLVIGFDTYDNGSSEEAPEITVRHNGNTVTTRTLPISVMRTGDGFVTIGVRISPAGVLDLYYGDHAIYRGLAVPGFVPVTGGRFGWGARTGGLNDNHWMDDVRIAVNSQPADRPTIGLARGANGLVLIWTGGGALQSAATPQGPWTTIAGAVSGHVVDPTADAQFYRVNQ